MMVEVLIVFMMMRYDGRGHVVVMSEVMVGVETMEELMEKVVKVLVELVMVMENIMEVIMKRR
jgi:hypothetical protein